MLGAESSLGDPVLGGPLTAEGFNFGCIKYRERTAENSWWWDLSNGKMVRRDKLWFTFPDPETGMEAWGRFIVSDPYYLKWLNAEQWALFARRYHGEDVPGFESYYRNLVSIAERFKSRAEEAGWDI